MKVEGWWNEMSSEEDVWVVASNVNVETVDGVGVIKYLGELQIVFKFENRQGF